MRQPAAVKEKEARSATDCKLAQISEVDLTPSLPQRFSSIHTRSRSVDLTLGFIMVPGSLASET